MADVVPNAVVLLFLGVFALLAAATLIGRRLAARADAADTERAAMIGNLGDRIFSWWVIVGVLALAFLAGEVATILLFGLVSFWCLREFTSLTPTPVADHYALAAAFYLFLPLQYLLLWDGCHKGKWMGKLP